MQDVATLTLKAQSSFDAPTDIDISAVKKHDTGYIDDSDWAIIENLEINATTTEFQIDFDAIDGFLREGKGQYLIMVCSSFGCTDRSEEERINNHNSKLISVGNRISLEKEEMQTEVDMKKEQLQEIRLAATNLLQKRFQLILQNLKKVKNSAKELEVNKTYLVELKRKVKSLKSDTEEILNNFLTYGADVNSSALGEGERAAVLHSFQSAFNRLPETEDDLDDVIRIANGRWPAQRSEKAEVTARQHFRKIYQREPDMNNSHDNAAITIMAYGLKQRAKNRNLESEKAGIGIFKAIYKYHPKETLDWNIMQAITYSGASR